VHNVDIAKWTLGPVFFCWVLVHPTMPRHDFTVYGDMDMHLVKLRLCFQKYKEFGISLNPYKCAFMLFSRMILGFIVSKECKLLNPKKIQTIVQMHVPINPQQINVFNRMAQFYKHFNKKFSFIMVPITKFMKKTTNFIDPRYVCSLGVDKT
jgi:hypothetical protein